MLNSNLALRRAVDAVQSIAEPVPPWADILGCAKDLIGGDSATFIVFEGRRLATFEGVTVDPGGQAAYVSHFHSQDIMLSDRPRPSGTWLDTQAALPPAERGKSGYYVDFMCRYRMRQHVSFVIEESPHCAASITVQRDVARDDTARQLASGPMQLFSGALLRAVARRRELGSRWFANAESAGAAFGEASLLVTGSGACLRMSANAQALLNGESALRVRNGSLWHPDGRVRDALANALAATARRNSKACSTSLLGERGTVLRLEFARAHECLRLGNESLVFMRMSRRREPSSIRIDALCLAFGLTPAEARVLAALADGRTPAAHALAQGVSIKQISTLMEKMDCTRQIDVVRMALTVS